MRPPPGGRNDKSAARRSMSAPHMHVLVCICSNVRQFSQLCHAQLSFWLIVLRLAVFWQPQPLAAILQPFTDVWWSAG